MYSQGPSRQVINANSCVFSDKFCPKIPSTVNSLEPAFCCSYLLAHSYVNIKYKYFIFYGICTLLQYNMCYSRRMHCIFFAIRGFHDASLSVSYQQVPEINTFERTERMKNTFNCKSQGYGYLYDMGCPLIFFSAFHN